MHSPLSLSVFLRAGESGTVNPVRDAHASATARGHAQAPGETGLASGESEDAEGKGRHARQPGGSLGCNL